MLIEVRQQDWIPGFAAFLADHPDPQGPAHVVLNLADILATVNAGDAEPSEVPYIVADCIMHEVMHALEEWAGVEFSEERVEALIEKYRAYAAAQDSGGVFVEIGDVIEGGVRVGRKVIRRECRVEYVNAHHGQQYAGGHFRTAAGEWSAHPRMFHKPWRLIRRTEGHPAPEEGRDG